MSNWFRTYGFADVEDKLLVGAYPLDQEDVGMLEWMKIERIFNLVEDAEYDPGTREEVEAALAAAGIEERRRSFTDYGRLPAAELDRAVREVLEWLDEGRRVYLHCRAGWQRSAAVAAGVVAVREGVEIDEALELVGQRKPSANPLPEQREDLRQWWAHRDPGLTARALESVADDPAEAVELTPGAAEWLHAMNVVTAVKGAFTADATDPVDPVDPVDPTDAAASIDPADSVDPADTTDPAASVGPATTDATAATTDATADTPSATDDASTADDKA